MATSDATAGRGDARTHVRVSLHGTPQLHGAGGSLALERRDAALLAWLALEGPTPRTRLLELLWPDAEAETTRNTLRQRLFQLKRRAGGDVVSGGELLALAPGVMVDPAIERDAAAPTHADRQTILLEGQDYADCPAFAAWLRRQREQHQTRRRETLVRDAEDAEHSGRLADAIQLAERLISLDAAQEHAHRRLMRLHYLRGDRAAALAAFGRCQRMLEEELHAAPAAETLALLATIESSGAIVASARRAPLPTSILRPPRLIGRARELEAIRLAWDSGRVFMLLGEAGMGKTRLLSELAAEVAGALHVQARPGDAGIPYASLARLLRALIERVPAVIEATPRRDLARVLPEIGDAGGATRDGRVVMLEKTIESVLRVAAEAGTGAVLFDDLHFADDASVEMVLALAAVDSQSSLRWGLAQRSADGSDATRALREGLEEAGRLDVIPLAPLDEAKITELVDSLGVPALKGALLAPLLLQRTGGNPLFMLETLKQMNSNGSSDVLPKPISVGQLIERRLRQLSAPAQALARVVAVAGADFSIELAEAVLDTRALALADAWRELEAANVLRGNGFAHDLVHDATLAGVPAPIAAHTHGAVAAFLEAHGAEPARIAAHLLDAGQPQRALAALHAAADAARNAMRRKEEAAFLTRAAQIENQAGDLVAAFESRRAAIDATWSVDLKALDTAMFDDLDAAATTTRQRAAALALRASWLQECGDLQQARRLARSAIDLAEAAGDEPTAVDARQRLAQILDVDGDYAGALVLLQPLLPWAAERASDSHQAEFYCRLGIVLDNTDRGGEARAYHQRALDAARRAALWNGVVTIQGNLAISWATAGYMQRAIDVLREALQLASAHDEARGSAASLPAEMYKCLRDCGRYAEALRWAEPALAAEPGLFAVLLQCHFACGWIHLGQHARAQREIDAALKAEVPDWTRAKALQMRARLKLALGQRGAGPLLAEALQGVRAQPGRRALRASIALDHALTLEPSAALAAAREVVAEGERLDLHGTALAGHIRATRFAVEAGLAADAIVHARAALVVGADVAPNDLYAAERWLNAWRALRLAGHDIEAQEVLLRGAAWVQETLQTNVPEPFRDSFGRANSVNQQLLRAAAAT